MEYLQKLAKWNHRCEELNSIPVVSKFIDMIIVSFLYFIISFVLSCHSAITNNISTPICPESSSCPGLTINFKYPFYNINDPQCGLININCTSKGGEVQLGRRWYEITGKFDSSENQGYDNIVIRNQTFQDLVNNKSCEALTNYYFTSPSPLLYSIVIYPNITLFKCTSNLTSAQRTDAYFKQPNYNSYKSCKDHNFYYNFFNGTVPNDLPHTCQVLQLPMKFSSSIRLDETNIFSLLSSFPSIFVSLSDSCNECHIRGHRCDAKNGQFQCLEPVKEKQGRKLTRFKIIVIIGVVVLVGSVLVGISVSLKRITRRRRNMGHNHTIEMFLKNHEFLAPKRYSYSQVVKMTNSFKVKLGQGGFGTVYKGVLKNEMPVAVKVISELKGDGEDFVNEVASVGRTSHVNIVSLVGFCLEGRQRALIYEFMPNGSLERFIYNHGSMNNNQLGWEKLHRIAIGIARGLDYLHKGCNTRILHLDIKPHNILLDDDFCPKISDFGLAKLFREKESRISMSHMRGTPGYIAPELFSRNFGEVSHKSDVYSYGMMILEMVGGRKNIDVEVDQTSELYFPHWIYKKVELHENQLGLHDIVSDDDNTIARKMIIVGLWCIQTNPLSRPTITRVLEMLEGDLELLEIPPKPYLSSPPRSFGSTSTI